MKACVLLRVSTTKQDEENQWSACETFCKARDWEIAKVIRERKTGTKDSDERIEALGGALSGQWQRIVVWSLDRWSRQGIEKTLGDMSRIKAAGAELVSVKETFTHDALYGPLITAILAWVAQYESTRRKDRTLEGLRVAKDKLSRGPYWRERDGKMVQVTRIGRAPVPTMTVEQRAVCRAALKGGVSWRALPKVLVGRGMPFDGGKDSKWGSIRKQLKTTP